MTRSVFSLFKSKISDRMKRYLLVGVSIYLFEVLVIVIAQQAGASAVVAVGIAFWLGLIVSFIFQKFFTFEDKRKQLSVVSLQFLLVCLLVIFNFFFTILFTKLTQSILPAFLCRAFALGITTIWNFALYKSHIFKQTV